MVKQKQIEKLFKVLKKTPLQRYGVFAVALLVVGSVAWLGTQNKKGSHAATGGTIYAAPAAADVSAGSTFNVAVRVTSGTNPINAAQASLSYDATKLQFVGITESSAFPTVGGTSTATAGLIRAARGTAIGKTVTGDQTLFTVQFKALATTGTTSVTFDKAFSNIALAADGTDMLSTVTGATYIFKAPGALSLSPASGSYAVGSNIAVTVQENSATELVNAVQAQVNYDATKLQFVSITEGTTFTTVAATNTTTAGSVRIARSLAPGSAGVSGVRNVSTINFKVIGAATSSTLSFDSSFSFIARASDTANVLGTTTGANYSFQQQATGSASMSLSPASGTYVQNSTISVTVKAASATAKMLSAQATLNYPASQLQYLGVTEGSSFTTMQRTNAATSGVVDIIRSVGGGTAGLTGTHDVITVRFKVIGTSGSPAITLGTTSGIFDDSGSGTNILATKSGASYQITPATTVTPGDANNDGRVNAIDLSILLSRDGQNYPAADFNNDGTVGSADLAILIGRWTW